MICSLKAITAKSSSLEHLNAIATKACYNITGDIRPRVAKTLYAAWHKMGFPISEEGKRIFKNVDRAGGLQKFMYEGDELFTTSLYLMAMQRDPETVKIACKMTWDIFVTDWLENKSLFNTERGMVKSLYDIFFNSEGYFPSPSEALNFSSGMLQLHSEMDHDDEAYANSSWRRI
ncbi:unnamed protein product [Ambrosiozyma monospora]|uniref:Unnamed protein product n=1 Tax=Ambrosiozyma monospora TaxID=43982 RepID=A0ACB5U848_AMBMO|nr:unnamed protein product [Ambrosiozyma monospora]